MTDVKPDPPADPAAPDLATVLQNNYDMPAVKVEVCGPVQVQRQPNRRGPSDINALTTTPLCVLRRDPRRARATLISTTAWNYRDRQAGIACPWPANVPLYLEHCDEVWADTGTTATLVVLQEFYAD